MAAGRGVRKSTCRKCNRTVCLVEIDGETVETDPELISVIAFDRTAEVTHARRLHRELCMSYASAAAKLRVDQERKRFNAKRPTNGRREPGQ